MINAILFSDVRCFSRLLSFMRRVGENCVIMNFILISYLFSEVIILWSNNAIIFSRTTVLLGGGSVGKLSELYDLTK